VNIIFYSVLAFLVIVPLVSLAQQKEVDILGNTSPCSLHGGFSMFDACHRAAASAQVRSKGHYSMEFVEWACSSDYTKLRNYISENGCGEAYEKFIVGRALLMLDYLYPSKRIIEDEATEGTSHHGGNGSLEFERPRSNSSGVGSK
jgi:hypothetical protein